MELRSLGEWWSKRGARLGIVWGRRRVGKTALIERFAAAHRTIFHTGGRRPVADELRTLSTTASAVLEGRDLSLNPFHDWADLLESLAGAARTTPALLVLDEFPELVAVSPELPSVVRAVWGRIASASKLRLLLCGSAVRTMEAMSEERAPLYGRVDLSLLLHPFRPHEAATMLPRLKPSERALVWGLVGGVPLYLKWWNQAKSVRENLLDLACRPGAPLLTEGHLVLATEGQEGDHSRQVLHAIAAGRTKHNEVADAIRADPTRTLDRLVALRLVERIVPVTEDPRRTRRRLYRIGDNFLAFWLGVLDRYRVEIDRGLGGTILPVLVQHLDDHMGPRWEEAFREHLRRAAGEGRLGRDVVAIGPFWTAAEDPNEIDAVVLAGRRREAVLVGEARWARSVDGTAIARDLRRKAAALPRARDDLQVAVCARETVRGGADLAFTAEEIFAG
ncbi:MAG: ATP-binding protein [Acidobacteria bacterium]|nr:ATP-binding protein [Acidobacteriota bacterium]